MAETLCQKRALEAFRLDPAKWGGKFLWLISLGQFLMIVKVAYMYVRAPSISTFDETVSSSSQTSWQLPNK